jgi:hypothetical protein
MFFKKEMILMFKFNKSKIINTFFIVFSIFLLSGFIYANAPSTEPCWVKGSITSEDFDVEDLTVGAYLGSTLLKSGEVSESGNFSLNSVGANDNDEIDLRVYGHTFETFTFEGFCKTGDNPWIVIEEFAVNKVANGQACSNDLICTSGNCSGGVCAAESTGGTTGPSDPGTTSPGTTSPGTTPPVTVQTTTESYSSSTSPVSSQELEEILDESDLTDEEKQEYLEALDQGILEITRELTVKKTTSQGQDTFESTFSIVIRNKSNKNLKDIKIVETIPKEIAEDASLISSPYQFRVLVQDPVIEFIIPLLNAGQSITIPYTVNNDVTEDQLNQMSGVIYKADFAEAEPTEPPAILPVIDPVDDVPGMGDDVKKEPVKEKSTLWLWIVIIILVILLILYFVYNSKGKKRGFIHLGSVHSHKHRSKRHGLRRSH